MTISLVGGICAGTDTGASNYTGQGTTVPSSSVTTQVGDLVLVLTCYAPYNGVPAGILRTVTLSGGTGSFTQVAERLYASTGGGAHVAFRIATVAETFAVTATLSADSGNREIVVAVFRSTNGAMSYVAASASTSEVPVTHPQAVSGPSYSATDNSLVACAVYMAAASSSYSGSTLNSFSKGETASDYQMFLYKGVASAGTETPGFNSAANTGTVLFLGGVFQEPAPSGVTIYDTASLNRGVGRGLFRGIA
jgi:hypothetical protein